jgi:hypothetical protein
MLSIGLWRWYINITITILDNIHRPTQRFGHLIALPTGPNWLGPIWKRKQNPVSQTSCVLNTGFMSGLLFPSTGFQEKWSPPPPKTHATELNSLPTIIDEDPTIHIPNLSKIRSTHGTDNHYHTLSAEKWTVFSNWKFVCEWRMSLLFFGLQ